MTHRYPFDTMFALPMLEEMSIQPKPGETPENALRRLKLRAAKWKPEGRAYRMKVDGDTIRIQRTPLDRNGPLSDWLLMKAGDRLLISTTSTANEWKAAASTRDYLNFRPVAGVTWDEREANFRGSWYMGKDSIGRLVVLCLRDEDGNDIREEPMIDGPVSEPWVYSVRS